METIFDMIRTLSSCSRRKDSRAPPGRTKITVLVPGAKTNNLAPRSTTSTTRELLLHAGIFLRRRGAPLYSQFGITISPHDLLLQIAR